MLTSNKSKPRYNHLKQKHFQKHITDLEKKNTTVASLFKILRATYHKVSEARLVYAITAIRIPLNRACISTAHYGTCAERQTVSDDIV